MRALVTGAAGFIGSTLVDRLLDDGHEVVGVDCFTPYYEPEAKRSNLAAALTHPRFELVEADLREVDIRPLLARVDVVFHQAGQPGVRPSWSAAFSEYVEHNVVATQRLLEAATEVPVDRIVYASSSSVYGNAASYPTSEDHLPQPHSPYGVTKLAAGHLCALYAENHGLPTVTLRYFTVYGPRQRPDMALHRLIEAGLAGEPFRLFGSGDQVRDFTYVDDVVDANLAAAAADAEPGTVCNIAGGSATSVNELIDLVAEIGDFDLDIVRDRAQPGDVARTGGATKRAQATLGWRPRTTLRDGLRAQVAWHRRRARTYTKADQPSGGSSRGSQRGV